MAIVLAVVAAFVLGLVLGMRYGSNEIDRGYSRLVKEVMRGHP